MSYKPNTYWIIAQKTNEGVLEKRYNQFKQVRSHLSGLIKKPKVYRVEERSSGNIVVELK